MDTVTQDNFRHDLCTTNETVLAGVSLDRPKAARSTWHQWGKFCYSLAIDPLLETCENKIPILQVFTQRERDGALSATKHPVRAQSAEDYLRNVAQTFQRMGAPDPRKTYKNAIDFRLQQMIAAWKKQDPLPNRVKPVPISVLSTASPLLPHNQHTHT